MKPSGMVAIIVIAGDLNVHNQYWSLIGSSETTRAGELMEEICFLQGLYQHITSPKRASNMFDLVISNFTSPVDTSIFPLCGTPTTHRSLQAFPSPFSESQRLQGESGDANMQIGRASGTFPEQRTGKRSSHPAQIHPAPGSLTMSFLECTNSFP